jgi:hypothetical protein
MTGHCQILWCQQRTQNLYRTLQTVRAAYYVIYICDQCYHLFGDELPDSEAVRLTLQRHQENPRKLLKTKDI